MTWFTDDDLRELASGRSYERGLGYTDAVGDIGDLPDGVVATVHGTSTYRVRLTDSDGVLHGECSCPYGRDGEFCKHCVAVGLRLLSGKVHVPRRKDLRQFLATMDRDELVDLVWQQATEDAGLFRRLQLRAATAAGGPDLSVLRTQVERLNVEWVAYGDEHTYVTGAEAVLEALERLVPGDAAAVQPLLRRAVQYVGAGASSSEDETGMIIGAADAAWEAYLAACQAAPPDPVELAQWYIDFQLDGPEWPDTSLDDVADLLGDKGLAAYGERLGEATRTHPGNWRLRMMHEEFIAATGSTDEIVACLAEDLTGPPQYVRIATVLREAGRLTDAIGWLERCPLEGHRATELIDLLAELYTEAGRASDVVALREKHFAATGSATAYRVLRTVAESAGRWPEIHDQALAVLRARVEAKTYRAADTLAETLLDEGEVTQAWDVIGQYRCEERTRLAVTERRAQTHPADAIAVYRPLVEEAVASTSNGGYQRAASLLLTMRDLYARTGGDFAAEVDRLRETHRRKRNFLAELARNGL